MNDESKLPQSIAGAIASWLCVAVSWMETHVAMFASIGAIIAALYSIWASRETIKLRRSERRQIEEHEHD